MPDQFEFTVGMNVGGATLKEKIGEGGQAIVFKARYNWRKVAVKVINPDLAPNLIEDSRRRFDREQNILLNLKHENVVEIIAAGTHKHKFQGKIVSIPYLIMELMAGPVYDPANGPLPWSEVVRIGIAAAKGLACAHENAIIHRDIKPGNILINKSGKVKVSDFGLSKTLDSDSLSRVSNTVVLTEAYASPEQQDPQQYQCTDQVSDIYSLGITYYEMLTGRWPFEANKRALDYYIRGLSEPASIDVEAPEELKALIMKMIKLKRSERPQSVKEVLDVLKDLIPEGDGKLKYIAIAALLLPIFAVTTLYYTGTIGNKPTLPPDEPLLISEVGQPANGPQETTLVNDTVSAPVIAFIAVPGYGGQGMLEGTVSFVEPSKYRVAVYVMVRGRWWTKPYWDQPLTAIKSNGSWECDIFTGELDHETSRIAAYLLPEGYDPPLMRGDVSLPEELNSISVASDFIDRGY